MASPDSPRVESFVLRFVNDVPENGVSLHPLASENPNSAETRASRQQRANWHAVVVHVQTNEEKTFTDFADAVAFIARYVAVGDFYFKMEDGGPKTDAEHLGHRSSVIRHSGEQV